MGYFPVLLPKSFDFDVGEPFGIVIAILKPMRVVALIFAFFFLTSMCSAGDERNSTESVIEAALGKLMLRGKEEHPWVAFTDSSSDRFIQFGYEKSTLFIDVPLIGRTDEEQKKLEQIFRSIGVRRPVTMQARDPKTLKSFTSRSYQADFSSDAKRAASFARRIFREVFGIDAPAITVEEGSG